MHCGKKAVDAVDRIAQEVFNQYDFYNAVLKEFTEFQTEFIPEEYYRSILVAVIVVANVFELYLVIGLSF